MALLGRVSREDAAAKVVGSADREEDLPIREITRSLPRSRLGERESNRQ